MNNENRKTISSIGRSRKRNAITYLMLFALFAIFQTLSSTKNLSRSTSGQLVPICVYVVVTLALNLVVGFSGELSLGHAGFLSIGAFSGVAFYHLFQFVGSPTVQLILSMICAGIISGLFGFVIGIPVLRLRGDYLAIVTLAFGEIIKNVMNCIYLGYDSEGWHFGFSKSLTLGSGGVAVLNGPMGVTGNKKVSTFLIGFILVIFAYTLIINLMNSKTGRAIIAIRDNRIAAESVGLSATRYKMTAFVVSAFLTGMAGALYVMNYASVAPSKFNFNTSILVLVFVVMGGMGNLQGGILAAIILTVLPEKLRSVGDYRMLIYAILLILMMLTTQSAKGRELLRKIFKPVRGGSHKDRSSDAKGADKA